MLCSEPMSVFPSCRRLATQPASYTRAGWHAAVLAFVVACGDPPALPPAIELAAIGIDQGARILERGTKQTITATALDREGDTIAVPVAWRSSNERVAVFERGGVLVALDTGITIITASALGVRSEPVAFGVIWLGAAKIDELSFSPPHALNPGATLTDSVRVRVTNVNGDPVATALVAFTVTEGGGSVSPFIDTTDANGVAATQWKLGPDERVNRVEAAVIRADSTPNPFVEDNHAEFVITSYTALSIAAGDGQSAQILSTLPQQPAVRLVDSLGNPRPGVPVQFMATSNGSVASTSVSTNASGVASPGAWTLGDLPGDQFLEARVADARVRLRATGTGTPVRYKPAVVVAGGFSTCARESSDAVKCWGEVPQIGTGGSSNVSVPTAVNAPLAAASVDGSATHYCAVATDARVWCWGVNALVDTSGATADASVPTRLPSDISWSRVVAGFAHNCGIDVASTAYCWGSNLAGQLGDGTSVTRLVPAPVTGGFSFQQISAGTLHNCALGVDGRAFCWGQNQFGQLGDATSDNRAAPTAVVGGHTFQTIAAGETFSCGLTTAGRPYCWGTLAGTTQLTPQTYAAAPDFRVLTAGSQHACALTLDGTAYCWGLNESGRLGDSTITTRSAPVQVAGDLRFAEISAGHAHTCGRTLDGELACWGRNRGGELGNDSVTFSSHPRYLVLGVTP